MKKLLLLLTLLCAVILAPGCADPVVIPANINPALMPKLVGVNAAGGEIYYKNLPANGVLTSGQQFKFISHQDVDYLASKKMNFIRLVFSWEALQPTLNGPLDTGVYGKAMKDTVDYATSKNMYVMVEPHGALYDAFAAYRGNQVGTAAVPNAAFADFWKKVADVYKTNPRVIYGLSNEPNNISTMQWFNAAQAAITGIRSTGSTQMIQVAGNQFSQPSSWEENWYDTATPKVSNATGFLTLKDPKNFLVVSVHTYADANAGGGANDIVRTTIYRERVNPTVVWARAHGLKVHLSEYGVNTGNPLAQATLVDLHNYLKDNADVVIGSAAWGYGPPDWWGNNSLTMCPKNNYTVDDPKMTWISPYLVAPTAAVPTFGTPTPTATPTPPPTVTTPPPVVSPSFPTNPMTVTKGTVFTTTSGGITNWAWVPPTYDSSHKTPTQLFVWLHGCGGQSEFDVSMVSYMTNQKWISLAPGGREKGCWSGEPTDGPKVLAAIADIRTRFNIDPYRIVLGGYSSGGDIGYPLLFKNAGLFSGALFENTGPNSAALTASKTAAWKVNIVHLAHLSDNTYSIASTRTNMTTLKNNGFPVTLIEKAGNHYDNDNGSFGTQYDLRTFLLPHLNDGWVAPGAPPPAPTSTVPPVVDAGPPPVVDAGTPPVVDAGTDSGVPPVALQFKVIEKVTSNWGSGYCKTLDLKNENKTAMSWSELQINLRGGKIRDQDNKGVPWDTWGGSFSARTGVIKVTPATWTKNVPAGSYVTIGFCADFGTVNPIWTGTFVIGSIKQP